MNKFEYVILSKKIDTMTTFKALEETMRMLRAKSTSDLLGAWGSTSHSTDKEIYEYKCYLKAYQKYTGKNLPVFLRETAMKASNAIFTQAIKEEVSYERLCEILEFTERVAMPGSKYSVFLPKLARVIGANKMPAVLHHNWYVSSPYSGTTAVVGGLSGHIDAIFEIEEVKRSLPATTRYTVIEDLLDAQYAHNKPITLAPELVTRMENWLTNAKTIQARIGSIK